jgi:hypothetical protein
MSPTILTGLSRHRGRSHEIVSLSSVYFALFPPEKLNLRNQWCAVKGLESKRPSKLNESQGAISRLAYLYHRPRLHFRGPFHVSFETGCWFRD